MKIPDITLPSNPGIIVKLREATVEDSIDFAGVQDGMEEAVTTLFLNTLQDSATYTDSKKWTGDDRRLVLFWYWIHTTDDFSPGLSFLCSVCGEEHVSTVDFRQLSNGYMPIKGKASREVEFGEEKVIVRPLSGKSLEEVELLMIQLPDAIESDGLGSGKVKTLKARLRLLEFMLSIEFKEEKGKDDFRSIREKKILAMGQKDFSSLAEKVESALKEMEHGLSSVYDDGKIYLLTPPIKCDKNEKEVGTQLRLPFRSFDYVPRL